MDAIFSVSFLLLNHEHQPKLRQMKLSVLQINFAGLPKPWKWQIYRHSFIILFRPKHDVLLL